MYEVYLILYISLLRYYPSARGLSRCLTMWRLDFPAWWVRARFDPPDYLRGRGVTSGGVGPWVGAALRGRPAHMCRCGVFTARARASAGVASGRPRLMSDEADIVLKAVPVGNFRCVMSLF